jgi:hypothetical protein
MVLLPKTLIQESNLISVPTFEFDVLPWDQFNTLEFVINNAIPASDGDILRLVLAVNDATYETTGYHIANNNTFNDGVNYPEGSTGTTSCNLCHSGAGVGNLGFEGWSGSIIFNNMREYADVYPKYRVEGQWWDNAATSRFAQIKGAGGCRADYGEVQKIKLYFSTGNFSQLTISVYGS